MRYKYNDKEFIGKMTKDKELEIYMNGKFLFVVDLDQFEDMSFKDIIDYLCDDNFANLYEEMYFYLKTLYQ